MPAVKAMAITAAPKLLRPAWDFVNFAVSFFSFMVSSSVER